MATSIPDHIIAPAEVELKQSLVDDKRVGAFCKDKLIPKDCEFGPFAGRIVLDKNNEEVDQKYSWEVYDLETFKFLHVVDATNSDNGNWMRFVCCARFFEEQNIVSTQNGTDVYYRALNDIQPGEELLTWFQVKKKKKRSSIRESRESTDSVVSAEANRGVPNEETELGTGKRKRKPKIIPDSYQGPLDFKLDPVIGNKKGKKVVDDDDFEPLQPGQKRRRRKKVTLSRESSTVSSPIEESTGIKTETPDDEDSKLDIKLEPNLHDEQENKSEKSTVESDKEGETKQHNEMSGEQKVKKPKHKTVVVLNAENSSIDWKFPEKGEEYVFKLKKQQILNSSKGKKTYKCEICKGLYQQMFSLKRHYLRNHINYKYLSKADLANCSISLVQAKQMLYERSMINEMKEKEMNEVNKAEGDDSFFEKLDKTVKPLPNNQTHEDDNAADSAKDETEKTIKPDCNDDLGIKQEQAEESATLDVHQDLQINIKKEKEDSEFEKLQGDSIDTVKDGQCKLDSSADKESSEDLEADTKMLHEVKDKPRSEISLLCDETFDSSMEGREDVESSNQDVVKNRIQEPNVHTTSDNEIRKEKDLKDSLLDGKKEDNEDKPNHVGETKNTDEQIETDVVKEEKNNDASDQTDTSSKGSEDKIIIKAMPGLYRCYTCYAVYDTVREIQDHLDDHPDQAFCFACDQCNMRFHFKQNLVRHQKVHENEEEVKKGKKKLWAKAMGDDSKIEKKKKRREEILAKTKPKDPVIEPKGTSDNLFKCNKCKTIFPNQRVLTTHVKMEHKDGGKFQCQYCGKDFQSMPNMKKHVRFHLGYRVRCRVCNEIFSNVGALRKHTRIVHPDIYIARRLDKLERDGALRVTDKTKLNKDKLNFRKGSGSLVDDDDEDIKSDITQKKYLKNNPTGQSPDPNTEDSKEGSSEEFLLETDITFEAHEIDDGGSRFKFSCTVCKKRFNSYINMCRHRRKVHSRENRQKLEEGLIFTRKSKNSTPPIVEDKKELEQFYANVSHNIAVNLNCFIDGKPEALEKYSDHIIVDNYTEGSFGYAEQTPDVTCISWEQYNFPPDFKPVFTVPVCDIKTEPSDRDNINNTAKGLKVSCSLDNGDNQLNKSDSVVDSEKGSQSGPESDTQPEKHSNQVVESPENTMGKSSTGIKALANVGINAMHKIAKSLEQLTSDSDRQNLVPPDTRERTQHQRNSPSSKNFCQVKNGEYSNFDDLMLGDDFSTLTPDDEFRRNRAHSSASARMMKRKLKFKRSHSAGDLIDQEDNAEAPDDLYNASQAELDDLYDCLDTGIECNVPNQVDSPKPLSSICERKLGLNTSDSKQKLELESTVTKSQTALHLLTNLSLSESVILENKEIPQTNIELKPDYSDASIESPFYNYDSIAFGRNGEITKVCAICKKHFADFDGLIHHHMKIHPSSACSFLEIEDGNDIESLHFAHPSNIGVLAVTDPGLASTGNIAAFTCTRCGTAFKSKARLHVHIVNCAPIDPVNGAIKDTLSHGKSPLKKKFQHKFDENGGQVDNKNQDVATQKRVFTGCRKRTAVLLPDSPVKMSFSERTVQDILSGYNPNNHVRRRELTELVDTLTCEACGQKFKTILLLERHVKTCAEKEKFKNVRPLACPIMDESLAKIKNICFYCDKNFTYSKSLMNHFQDFCPVKKGKVDRGELTKDDIVKEKEITERLQRQEEDKLSKDKDLDGQKKKSWQVGRKPKRKGHSWTYIKKRKQNLISLQNGLQENVLDDGDFSDESSTNGSFQNGDKLSDTEADGLKEQDDSIQKLHDANGNFVLMDRDCKGDSAAWNYDEVDSGSSETKADHKENTFEMNQANSEDNMMDTMEADSKCFVERSHHEFNKDNYPKEMFISNPMDTVKRNSVGVNELLSNWDRDANTSLEFTSRYKVNRVSVPTKKVVTKKPSLLQCVMSHNNGSPVNDIVPDKVERTKRKRERCGKVEAFLQNVFKRKKKKEAMTQENQVRIAEKESISDKITPQSTNLLEESLLENNEKGNTLLHLPNTNTDNEILNNATDNKLTHIPTNFSHQDQDTKHYINMTADLPGIEVKQDHTGEIRYLFKRGRPRKHQPNEKKRPSENETVEESHDMKKAYKAINQPGTVSPGRGRPRKHSVKETGMEKNLVEKRPRGRPPKSSSLLDKIKQSNKSIPDHEGKEGLRSLEDSETCLTDITQYDNLEGSSIIEAGNTDESKEKQCFSRENCNEKQNDLRPEDLKNEDVLKQIKYNASTSIHQSAITGNELKTESDVKGQSIESSGVQDVMSKSDKTLSCDILLQYCPKDEGKNNETEADDENHDATKCYETHEQENKQYIPAADRANKDLLSVDKTLKSELNKGTDDESVKAPTLECEYLNHEVKFDETTKSGIQTSHSTNVTNFNLKTDCVVEDVPPVLEAELDQVCISAPQSDNVVNDKPICDSAEIEEKVADNSESNELITDKQSVKDATKVLSESEESIQSVNNVPQSDTSEKTESVQSESQSESPDIATSVLKDQQNESLIQSESVPIVQQNESPSKSESVPKGVDDEDINLLEFYSSVMLSPSERVKTNKRSCKKESSPYLPVWVKQRKPRTKTGSVECESDTPTEQNVVVEKKAVSTDNSAIESSSKCVHGASNDLKKDTGIPKALKRKLEIVRKFDSRRKLQKQ